MPNGRLHEQFSRQYRRGPGVILVAGFLLVGASCATADSSSEEDPSAVTMAPAQFGGSYRLGPSELADGSAPVSAEITINVTDGSVTVATDCRTYLGSFTLGGEGERGTASFTLPGLGPTDCPTDLLEADSGLINALEVVTAWEIDENDSLVLTSPAGDRLVLQGSG